MSRFSYNRPDKQVIKAYAKWVDELLQPDVYIVATLKTSVGTYATGSKTFVKADETFYERVFRKFIKSLSRSVYHDTNYFRYEHCIPNFATLEDCFGEGRPHLNIMLKRPQFIPFEEFQRLIDQEWQAMPVAMRDIKIQQRTGNCTLYSLKEGCERIFLPVGIFTLN